MPEARDRLSMQDEFSATFGNRRPISSSGNRNVERDNSVTFILEDEADDEQATRTPFRWRGTPMAGTPGRMGVASGRGSIGTTRIGRGANVNRSPARIVGRENLSPVVGSGRGRGGGRGRGSSILPYWYRRKPLGDITAIVRAIERTRARLGEGEGLRTDSPILQEPTIHDPFVSIPDAQLEHGVSMISPTIGKVPRILLDITNQNDGESSSCLTPQKKLLNNIDTVEKVVTEELRKLKRTPSAKKAEREKRVRTLMSMR
ncbi:hypothetical protein BUALT_Bualt12G0009500 [Buddleja alternifolia]|uniref:Protein POLYCHOME n=1 Tax=Buddleja alternifolia TaxID=168488 RepID=A0AAV6WMW6_9LAMI|nr:hypothetical protein BUALT_Bualt12G0009500 [Buddleja alternifolia]